MSPAIFFTIDKNYETQKAHRKAKNCPSIQQSIGLFGASCYLCKHSSFFEPKNRQKGNWKIVKICKKIIFQKISLFSITQQLFAKLLSHSSPPIKTHIEVFFDEVQLRVRPAFERSKRGANSQLN